MMRLRWLTAIVAVAVVLLAACSSSSSQRVVVGAGTTLVDSQLMAELVAAYGLVDPAATISVVGLSSSEAIAIAESGDADLIITHNPDALEVYLADNANAESRPVFTSSFFVVTDPSIEIKASSAEDAMAVIAERPETFVSRDDGSGTNAAELAAWDRVGIDPSNEHWYVRTGTGMGATLLVTDQKHAATLTEHGAYLASSDTLSLAPVANTELPNPYDLTTTDPGGNDAAERFAEWLVSPEGVVALQEANARLFGQQVYIAP